MAGSSNLLIAVLATLTVLASGCGQLDEATPNRATLVGATPLRATSDGVPSEEAASVGVSPGVVRPVDATPTPPPRRPSPTPRPPALKPIPGMIVMTVADAEREVASWPIPEVEGRIERAGVFTVEQLTDALWPEQDWLGLHGGLIGGMDIGIELPEWPEVVVGPLIVVEASQRGVDVARPALWADIWDTRQPSTCLPVPKAVRFTFSAIFDAATGHYLGHSFEAMPDALWDQAAGDVSAAAPTALTAVATRTPTPTATAMLQPVPTATSVSVGLDSASSPSGEGEVPEALLPVAETLPWVAGSRWVYRLTTMEDGVRWWTATVTETVETARRVAPAGMEVRLAWESSRANIEPSPWFNYPVPWRPNAFLVRDGVAFPSGRAPIPDASALDLGPVQPADKLDRDSPLEVLFRLPLTVGQHSGLRLNIRGMESMTVPAGRFAECFVIGEIASARSGVDHWLCPGTGFARHEFAACSGAFFGRFIMYELVDVHIPPLVPVP